MIHNMIRRTRTSNPSPVPCLRLLSPVYNVPITPLHPKPCVCLLTDPCYLPTESIYLIPEHDRNPLLEKIDFSVSVRGSHRKLEFLDTVRRGPQKRIFSSIKKPYSRHERFDFPTRTFSKKENREERKKEKGK